MSHIAHAICTAVVFAWALLPFPVFSSAFLASSHRKSHLLVPPLIRHSTLSASASSDGDGEAKTLSEIQFRTATTHDIPRCYEIETASYPPDEAATMESLIYRQARAGEYFLVCTHGGDGREDVLGFVCATRCQEFTEESMSEHCPSGKLLAIHSVVIDQDYRRRGLASRLLAAYVQTVKEQEAATSPAAASPSSPPPIQSMVLLAKQHLLGFYVRAGGFVVNRPSPIVHGQELWYELELKLPPKVRNRPRPGEAWFCKTETFKPSLTFPEIKPHLDAHSRWVEDLRASGDVCIVSGYRVDSEGKPGGGGLMFVAAKSYDEAYELVSQHDPLIVHGCVDWELHGWKSQVGGIQVD